MRSVRRLDLLVVAAESDARCNHGVLGADDNTEPHEAFPLPRLGPLAVHPWWLPLQRRFLETWESGTTEGSSWGVKSVTTESTFFPLVDSLGNPVSQTHRLVLTPGGLSSS